MGGASVIAKGKTLDDLQRDIDKLTKEADRKRLALDNMTEAVYNPETQLWEQGLHFSTSAWG
jgi:hypothetical protein